MSFLIARSIQLISCCCCYTVKIWLSFGKNNKQNDKSTIGLKVQISILSNLTNNKKANRSQCGTQLQNRYAYKSRTQILRIMTTQCRAVRRSQNPWGYVIMWWAQSALLVDIGLTDLPKTCEHMPPSPSGPYGILGNTQEVLVKFIILLNTNPFIYYLDV